MSQKLPDDSAKNELLKKSRKINKLNLKIKNGCSSKDTVKKKKNPTQTGRTICKTCPTNDL